MTKFYLTVALLISVLFSAQAQCTDLFFSEYVEGSSNNKAVEIYNPTAIAVNLATYRVQLYTNGAVTPNTTLTLTGTLNPGAVYVICHPSANDSIKSVAATTSNVVNFNGNDAVILLKGNDTLDAIGRVGENPGTSWTVGTGSTLDKTLIRKFDIQEGTKDWAIGVTQWDVLPRDTIRLGAHSMLSCGVITDTLVRFSPVSATVSENAGTYNINIQLNAASSSTTFEVDVVLIGGTGDSTDIEDYTTQTITFAPGTSSQQLTINITDDADQEPAETFVFRLVNPTNGLLLGADSIFTLTIAASDAPIQFYNISQITGLNSNFEPDSLGVKVRITGTVIGINYRATGLEFFVNDATDGIGVFSPTSTFGYTVAEGDSLIIEGEVGFFNGLTQIRFMDTLYKVGTGVVPVPLVVQNLDEDSEARLVRLNNVQLATPSQWNNSNPNGFTCSITDGVDTWSLRIDEQCALYNQPAPTGKFNVIGIGSQFDNSAPYNSGYQLLPRFASDIILISGIDELGASKVQLYPNPNNGNFMISVTEQSVIRAYTIEGKLVAQTEVTPGINQINSTSTPGTYVIEVVNASGTSRTKISVQ